MPHMQRPFLEKIKREHGPVGLTADIVVVCHQQGKVSILLIRRSKKLHEPFPSQWALPGGFLGKGETLEEAARRELREETGAFMLPALTQIGTFSAPERDPRGRMISTAFLALVQRGDVHPRAGSDATEVRWFPINNLPTPLAFDHDKIIAKALEVLRPPQHTVRIYAPPRSLDDRNLEKPRQHKRKPQRAKRRPG